MGLLDALSDLLSGRRDPHESERETFEYRCRDCDHEFESTRRHVTAASCPDRGSEDVRVGDDPY